MQVHPKKDSHCTMPQAIAYPRPTHTPFAGSAETYSSTEEKVDILTSNGQVDLSESPLMTVVHASAAETLGHDPGKCSVSCGVCCEIDVLREAELA